ncbi:MAG: hypothetical protein KR126chlam4_01113 [Candidatus Anoxychlamydiales bacterium]|nr:hypothetical protein [Candidatus Anoxychlamydiales bacterium]HEU64484.1 O-antigen ligase family protein [Chlamydiota bacterium]
MYQKILFYLKKHENFPYKIILYALLIIISPAIFKILDHKFQKLFSLNRYINIIDFIFLGIFSFWYFKKDKLKIKFSKNLILLILYLLMARLSIVLSIGQIHHRAYYDLFRASILIFVLLSFFSETFQKHKKIVIKTILTLFFTFALLQTSIAILQFILQKSLGFTFLHEPFFAHNLGGSCKIQIAENAQFFLKYLPSQNNLFLRAHGTFIHPNVLSGFLNVSSLLTLYFIYKSKNKIFSLFLFFQIIALILTFSRAGLASFVVSSFCFFILMLYKKYRVKKMFLSFLVIILSLGVIGSKQLIERGFLGSSFQSKDASLMNKQSDFIRESLKNASINMIKKHPYFGVGFRNFLIKRNEYSKIPVQRAYVHNIYLLIAAETGLISLLIFLMLIFFTIYETFRYSLNPISITSICIILSFMLIGFFDHYPIASNFGRMVILSFLSLLNYFNELNKPFSYSQKASLYQ